MRRFLVSQLRHRAGRSLTLALGILVAAVAFVLLTGSARTSSLHVEKTLKSNYRGAYDVLVRPKGSFTQLERTEGLVRDNYLSGIYGGITLRQYHEIQKLPGVEVAAPIANIGYLMFPGSVALSLRPYVTKAKNQLYRVRWSWASNGGLSHYAASSSYLYYNPSPPPAPTQVPLCTGFEASTPHRGPFDPGQTASLTCSWRARTPPPFVVAPEAFFFFRFPVLLAAIDPVEEARLVHLDRSVVRGRYLSEGHGLKILLTDRRVVSVLASTRTFLGDRLLASVERLRPPQGADVRALLSAGACKAPQVPCPQGLTYLAPTGWPSNTTAYGFLNELQGKTIVRRSFSADTAYKAATKRPSYHAIFYGRGIFSDAFWTTSESRYRRLSKDRLAVLTASNPLSIWHDDLNPGANYWFPSPPENRDTQFRRLHESPGNNQGGPQGAVEQPELDVVGRFNPNLLPGFSPLSKLPLETYYPPELLPADRRSRVLLHGQPLLPTQNLGDYIQQPPLLLTSLDTLASFETNPLAYTNVSALQRRAPISVIRVRVAHVTGTDALSRLRIRTVAQDIHDTTGLDVDVTAGTSPHPLRITLPAGKFGRPQLLLEEGWSKKGTTIRYLTALDRKDLALYALILVVCAMFLVNGALASVRARRTEIGVLLTLGWSRGAIFRAVLGELALVGTAAGAVGTGLAAGLVQGFGLALPLSRTPYVLPIAVALALVAGLLPAWEAARGTPLDALLPPVHASRRRRNVRGLLTLALVNLTRLPLRTTLGAAGLALGVAALTILIAIEQSFQGTLVGTLLGNAVSLQIRNADFVAVGLTIGLAAASVADVLYMNLRERAAEFVTLQTSGWSSRQITAVSLLEALGLGFLAALVGAGTGIGIGGVLLGVAYGPLAIAASIAGAGALAAAIVASLIPTVRLLRLNPPTVLAAE